MFKFLKKAKTKANNNSIIEKVEDKTNDIKKTEFFKKYIQEKKQMLPKGAMTREEVLAELEKQFQNNKHGDKNPFKTRDDRYFLFFNSDMSLNRDPVPFEEVTVGGKKFYINKKFENGKIIIEQLIGAPDLEINLKDEYNKKETTKKQIEKLNQYILFINNKVSRGEEKYKLLDIEDIKEEKFRLEKIIESIKYGKIAIFDLEDPTTRRRSYWLRYSNGEYNYLKVTENNYIVEENNIKFIKGYDILKKLENIANLRIVKNWKEIIYGILAAVIIIAILFSLYKISTFEETLFDERVENYCGSQSENYQDQIDYIRNTKCDVQYDKLPDYKNPD